MREGTAQWESGSLKLFGSGNVEHPTYGGSSVEVYHTSKLLTNLFSIAHNSTLYNVPFIKYQQELNMQR